MMKPSPSALKWLAEKRARIANEYEQTLVIALELTQRTDQLKQDLEALDRTMGIYDARIQPSSIESVNGWRGMESLKKASAAEFSKRKASQAIAAKAAKLLVQDEYARRADRALLDAGIESEVAVKRTTKGSTLQVSSAIAGRVFADRIANKAGLFDGAQAAGFDKLVFVNSIGGTSYTYTLDPKDTSFRELEREVARKWGMEG